VEIEAYQVRSTMERHLYHLLQGSVTHLLFHTNKIRKTFLAIVLEKNIKVRVRKERRKIVDEMIER
jgi:hypothetical protein